MLIKKLAEHQVRPRFHALAFLTAMTLAGSVSAADRPKSTLYSCNLINPALYCREYLMAAEAVELTTEFRERCGSMEGSFLAEPCPVAHRVSQCRNIVRGKLLVKEIWLKTNYENTDSAIYHNHYYTEAARTVTSPLPKDAMRWNSEESERTCHELKGDFIPGP